LLDGEADVGVAEISEIKNDRRFAIESLPMHRGVMFARKGHPLSRRRDVSLKDVAEFLFVCAELPYRLHELFRRRGSSGRSVQSVWVVVTAEMLPCRRMGQKRVARER